MPTSEINVILINVLERKGQHIVKVSALVSKFTLYTFMFAILVAASFMRHDDAAPTLTGNLPIRAPRAAAAGDTIQVIVGPVQASNGTPIGLVSVGLYGPMLYNSVFESGIANFTIPADHTDQPGYLALIAAADHARGQTSIRLLARRRLYIYDSPQLADNTNYQLK